MNHALVSNFINTSVSSLDEYINYVQSLDPQSMRHLEGLNQVVSNYAKDILFFQRYLLPGFIVEAHKAEQQALEASASPSVTEGEIIPPVDA